MMALLFLLDTVAIALAWCGQRKIALWVFFFSLLLSSVWFGHHITSHLQLDL
ncbi:MAG: DUF5993 family protein [Coxiellaceae bacterium]|nr:DUF5993 family protein [Coxiellaceae bacterium]